MLQPTTPFRKISEIVKAINKLKKENLESIMSVTPLREHPNESIIFKGKKWNYLVKPKKIITVDKNSLKILFYRWKFLYF